MSNMEAVYTKFPTALKDRTKAYAQMHGLSMAAAIRILLTQALECAEAERARRTN